MHRHICKYCDRDFLCDEPLECFKTLQACDECFWKHDFKHFLLFFFLAAVAGSLTIVLFKLWSF